MNIKKTIDNFKLTEISSRKKAIEKAIDNLNTGDILLVAGKGHETVQEIGEKKIYFSDHHLSHAASAFFPSPFQEAAFITLDGVGEWSTSSFGISRARFGKLFHFIFLPYYLAFTVLTIRI